MEKMTLFGHLKDFINTRWTWTYDAEFTTDNMRGRIGHHERLTGWKKYHKNPNYVLHSYLGELRELGCITRIGHGKYKINGPIPEWFGSYHFKGLKGKLNDKSNLYWNSLPDNHKVNPWAKQRLGFGEDTSTTTMVEVEEDAIQYEIASARSLLKELQVKIDSLETIAANTKKAKPYLISEEDSHIRRFCLEYKGREYVVEKIVNSSDVYTPSWYVYDNTEDNKFVHDEVRNTLIEYCK